MTNPISKAIVKAAVAMGYGKKSDYKGSSVADVLEKFAAIVKEKGGSGSGERFVVTGTFNEGTMERGTVDKTNSEIEDAIENNREVVFVLAEDGAVLTSKLAYKMVMDDASTYAFLYWESGPVQIAIANGEFGFFRST